MADDFETFRDHFLSIYQSAVYDVALRLDNSRQNLAGRRSAKALSARSRLPKIAAEIARSEYENRFGNNKKSKSQDQRRELSTRDAMQVCAELAFKYMKAKLSGNQSEIEKIRGEFIGSTCDPAWVTTIEKYLSYFGLKGDRAQIPYIRPSSVGPAVIEISNSARISMLGDWGTGATPAIRVLKQIAEWQPDVLIHLGDIYYSGTPLECRLNFSDIIDRTVRRNGRQCAVYTLSGNHDMYCGGVGYYGLIEDLNKGSLKQTASFFCLRTSDERWQFLAMDTGLHDYNPLGVADALTYLEPEEIEWHCDRISEFPGRSILLSHHQPFSAFSPIGTADELGRRSGTNPRLMETYNILKMKGRVNAWFWGHEHSLGIYKPFLEIEFGRCLGHGGVPVSVVDKIYQPLPEIQNPPSIIQGTESGSDGDVYAHGYAQLSLSEKSLSAEYFQIIREKPHSVFKEEITNI